VQQGHILPCLGGLSEAQCPPEDGKLRDRLVCPRLAGKVAIITGAARGIGAACTRRFVVEGARVALFDLPGEAGCAQALVADLGSAARFFACDVTQACACDAAVVAAVAALGPPSVLVNNAGISIPGGLEEMSEADWDRLFAVNVKAIHLLGRRVIPLMRAAGGGSIINVASESAFIGFPMHPAYCASKAAVVHLSRSMAVRYAPDCIRVNALCPGTIDTDLYRGFLAQHSDPEAVHARVLAMHPLGLGTPDDIAAAALYLASDEARYVTGAPMLVDGGATAQ
jgi:NAD(P)-dependent dehydrogenase (short-subunit alcohol dehydrogenase family)